jgi:hypothetical protein
MSNPFPLAKVEASNLAPEAKTQIRAFADKVKALTAPVVASPSVASVGHQAGQLGVEAGEAALTGAAIGAAEALLDSDKIKIPGVGEISVAGAVAGAAAGGALLGAITGSELAPHARHVSAAALAIFVRDKTRGALSGGKGIKGALPAAHGEPDALLEELKNDL